MRSTGTVLDLIRPSLETERAFVQYKRLYVNFVKEKERDMNTVVIQKKIINLIN